MFNPGVSIGKELTNEEMRILFKCANMGGDATLKTNRYVSNYFR